MYASKLGGPVFTWKHKKPDLHDVIDDLHDTLSSFGGNQNKKMACDFFFQVKSFSECITLPEAAVLFTK